jgi:hypothetical protein
LPSAEVEGGAEWIVEMPEGDEEEFPELELFDEVTEEIVTAPALMEDEPADTAEEEVPVSTSNASNESPAIITSTVAELFVAQGHPEEAAQIYRQLAASDPDNSSFASRLAELEQEPAGAIVCTADVHEEVPPADLPVGEQVMLCAASPSFGGNAANGSEEVIATMQRWLDTIRRIRQCRSGTV